MQFVY